jgi:hypothetical protein
MEEELIKKYIAYPMAITIFKQDRDKFKASKLSNLYEDMIDSIIQRMQQDYFQLKAEMFSKHHIDIKRIDIGKYEVNKEIIEFTSKELKEMTRALMSDYLNGSKAAGFERMDRTWE